jgi:DNA-3-methyladenine glycosylase II
LRLDGVYDRRPRIEQANPMQARHSISTGDARGEHAEKTGPLDKTALLRATRELCARDADLDRAVARYGPPPLWARPTGFATLVRIILEQQVSLASAEAMFARLRDAVGRVSSVRIARLSTAELRRLGLTRQKAGYCLGLAQQIENGELSLRQFAKYDDATARRILTQVRGIGPWTADIYLLMALRRPDVWPEGDLALATAVRRLKRLRAQPAPERLRRIADSWRPWRSSAARILWHFYLSQPRSVG